MQVQRHSNSPAFETLGELRTWLTGMASVPDAAVMHVAHYGIQAEWEEPTGTVRSRTGFRPATLGEFREWVAGLATATAPDEARLYVDDGNVSVAWEEER